MKGAVDPCLLSVDKGTAATSMQRAGDEPWLDPEVPVLRGWALPVTWTAASIDTSCEEPLCSLWMCLFVDGIRDLPCSLVFSESGSVESHSSGDSGLFPVS